MISPRDRPNSDCSRGKPYVWSELDPLLKNEGKTLLISISIIVQSILYTSLAKFNQHCFEICHTDSHRFSTFFRCKLLTVCLAVRPSGQNIVGPLNQRTIVLFYCKDQGSGETQLWPCNLVLFGAIEAFYNNAADYQQLNSPFGQWSRRGQHPKYLEKISVHPFECLYLHMLCYAMLWCNILHK